MKKLFILLFAAFTLSPVMAQSPNYSEDIAPIIYNHCSTCHRSGEIGPMKLTNYDEVKNWAETIKYVTNIQYMPPWKADRDYSELLNVNALSDEQIQTISDWVDAGMPQGDPADEPDFPDFPEGSLLGEPDLTLNFAQTHIHQGNNIDEYRYFVLPTGLTEDKILKAIEFRPGNTEIVHHALMFEDLEGVAAQTDATTPEYGFQGFGGFDGSGSVLGQKQYPGYVPGQKPYRFADGMGQTMGAGADLVVQVHYAPWPVDAPDSSSVNIFFAEESESVDRYVEDYIMLPFNLLGGFFSFFIPPQQVKTFHGTWTLPEKRSFIGLSPHMHLLGLDWEVYVEHQDGSRSNMIKIDDWDFNWQGDYYFKRFIVAEEGDVVHAIASYDNTSENPNNPSNPPQTVTWGEFTTDEMYYLPLFSVPYKNGDENVVFDETTSLEDIGVYDNNNKLYPIAPNPAYGMMNIGLSLKRGGPISVQVVDINGRVIRNIHINEFFSSGKHIINIDAEQFSSGLYFVNVKGKDFSLSEKFVRQ